MSSGILCKFVRQSVQTRAFHQTKPVQQSAGASGEQLAKQWPINFLLPVAGLWVVMHAWDAYKFTMDLVCQVGDLTHIFYLISPV